MSRIDDLQLYTEVAGLLGRPNGFVSSWNGLGKRLRLNDDRPRRAVVRLEQTFRTALVESKNNRLTLTVAGKRLFTQVEKLLALRSAFADLDALESLTVEVDDDLSAWLFPTLLPALFDEFAGAVQLRLCPLDTGRVAANIAAGLTNFGLGLDVVDSPAGEAVEPGFGWRLVVPASHRLSSLTADEVPQLGPVDRVFLALGRVPAGAEELIQHTLRPNRVECGSFHTVLATVAAGHGVGIVPDFLPAPTGCRVIPLADLQAGYCVLYLPRSEEMLSDPARVLLGLVREALRPVVNTGDAVTAGEAGDDSETFDADALVAGGLTP